MTQTIKSTKRVALTALKPYPKNPRRGDVDEIAQSLRDHGQYRALVVNKDGTVLAGNHTFLALQQIEAKDALCHFVDVDKDEAKRINLVDNRTGDLAGYDEQLLVEQLKSLPSLDGTGYSDAELVQFMASPTSGGNTSKLPPVPAPATNCKPDDVWLLGEHRLVCGETDLDECDALIESYERDTGKTATLET